MYNQTCIEGTRGNLKICPILAVALYIEVRFIFLCNLYALLINRKNEAACPLSLMQV